jgi:hypothetical protein
MLFRQEFLDGIRAGTITLAFRRWRRPSVRTGGMLRTAIGELAIQSVEPCPIDGISDEDARRAGYASRAALFAELNARDEGEVYRVELGPVRPDGRIALREAAPSPEEISEVQRRLDRLDARAGSGPWTRRTLEIIAAHPGVWSGNLARMLGQPQDQFKRNVRKLKELGLTESLEVGYRLSLRGESVLKVLSR